MSKTLISQKYQEWLEHRKYVEQMTELTSVDTPEERLKRIERAQKDYAYFCHYYFPHYAKVECADFHLKTAKLILENPTIQLCEIWARGHAKSTHLGVLIPLWLKIQKKRSINFMVLSSKSETAASRLLGDLQAELMSNKRYINDYGTQYQYGNWEEGEFCSADGVMFVAVGRGQSPRGLKERDKRPDYILLDDMDDDEMVNNEKRIKRAVDWCLEALGGTMDMWRGRFIAAGNLFAKNSILQSLSEVRGMRVHKVNALDKNGLPRWFQKYSLKEIRSVRELLGERRFQKEYMNNPVQEGGVFKPEWIKYRKVQPLKKYEHLIVYIDPSFKASSKSDYKACRFWGKIGREIDLLDTFVRQASVSAMVRWCYDLYDTIPEDVSLMFYMEANFMQDIILDEFAAEGDTRGYQLPIVGDMRSKPDKFQRIEAVSPLWERGFIFYNEAKKSDPDMQRGIEQTLAIEKGSRMPDDAPDADEGAIWILQRKTRTEAWAPSLGGKTRNTKW